MLLFCALSPVRLTLPLDFDFLIKNQASVCLPLLLTPCLHVQAEFSKYAHDQLQDLLVPDVPGADGADIPDVDDAAPAPAPAPAPARDPDQDQDSDPEDEGIRLASL